MWLLFTAVLILASCSYNFEEDFYKEINRTEPTVQINFTNFTPSEELGSSRTIGYEVTGANERFFNINFSVDGVQIHQYHETTGEFFMNIEDLIDGERQLEVEISFASGSGTLADRVNAEIYSLNASFPFTIDSSLADPFPITSVEIEEGSIAINFGPITDDNFEEAFLIIEDIDGNRREQPITTQELADLKAFDRETVHGSPRYTIKTSNPFLEKFGNYTVIDIAPFRMRLEPIDFDSFKIVNEPYALYGNLDEIITRYYYSIHFNSYISLNPAGGETIVNMPYEFTDDIRQSVTYRRNGESIFNEHLNLEFATSLTFQYHGGNIFYIDSEDKYYAFLLEGSDYKVNTLNGSTKNLEQSTIINHVIPAYSWIKEVEMDPVSNHMYINMRDQTVVFDPISSSVVETHHKNDYNPHLSETFVWYRGEYIILQERHYGGKVEIYDKNTGAMVFDDIIRSHFFSKIDLSYFTLDRNLYKLESGSFNFDYELQDTQGNRPASLQKMVFNTSSETAVYTGYGNSYIIDLETGQTTLMNGYRNPKVNFVNDHTLLVSYSPVHLTDVCELMDLTTGSTRKIRVSDPWDDFKYLNEALFSSEGYFLESDLYQ